MCATSQFIRSLFTIETVLADLELTKYLFSHVHMFIIIFYIHISHYLFQISELN